MAAYGQSQPYKEGSVWTVSLIKTNANMNEEYLTQLKTTWIAVHDEAIKQGLIISYKVLAGSSANPNDWDIMLLVEYKNLASLEGQDIKWDEIYKKIIGDNEAKKKLNESRISVRTIFGEKFLREISYK
ncbi:MAG: hypothetical protein D4R97_08475 [Bacteroidetes bacterium]|nr:MAG: hypothetical protein D4R97_08475 [Bacteroidota bacterium]